MKKILFLAAAALLSTGVFAQGLSYGVKAGLNMANIGGTEETTGVSQSMRMGFHAGVVGEYKVNDFWGVQAELLYSQQGMKMTLDNVDGKMVQKMDYINLPVMAKLSLAEGLSLEVGPQFGYLMSAKQVTSGFDTAATGIDNETVDLLDEKNVGKDYLKKLDVSAALGLSYRLACGVEVSARYNLGLTAMTDKDLDSNGKKLAPKNNVISVGVGYRF